MDFKKLLLTILGLAEDADDAAIESAAAAFAEKAGKEEASPELKAMSAEIATLKDTVAKLTGSDEGRARDAIVAKATSEGKVIPLSAEDINKLPLTILSAMVEKIEPTIPLDRRTPVTLSAEGRAAHETAAEAEVRKNLGVSKEAWDKYNPAA